MAEELSWRPPTPRHEDQPRWSYLVNGVIKDYRRQGISGVFLPLPGRGARRHLYGKVYEDWKERNEEKRPPKKTTEPKPKADEAHERSSPAKTRLEKLGSLISGIVVQGNAKEKKGEDKTKHVKLEPRPQDRPSVFVSPPSQEPPNQGPSMSGALPSAPSHDSSLPASSVDHRSTRRGSTRSGNDRSFDATLHGVPRPVGSPGASSISSIRPGSSASNHPAPSLQHNNRASQRDSRSSHHSNFERDLDTLPPYVSRPPSTPAYSTPQARQSAAVRGTAERSLSGDVANSDLRSNHSISTMPESLRSSHHASIADVSRRPSRSARSIPLTPVSSRRSSNQRLDETRSSHLDTQSSLADPPRYNTSPHHPSTPSSHRTSSTHRHRASSHHPTFAVPNMPPSQTDHPQSRFDYDRGTRSRGSRVASNSAAAHSTASARGSGRATSTHSDGRFHQGQGQGQGYGRPSTVVERTEPDSEDDDDDDEDDSEDGTAATVMTRDGETVAISML